MVQENSGNIISHARNPEIRHRVSAAVGAIEHQFRPASEDTKAFFSRHVIFGEEQNKSEIPVV
jgi:hypothetical protein